MDCSSARRVNKTARVVYSHEPEPEGSGILYGGAEVEAGMDAEAERSMLHTVFVAFVVVNDGEQTGRWGWLVESGGDGTNRIG
jgi:hypothetical protein